MSSFWLALSLWLAKSLAPAPAAPGEVHEPTVRGSISVSQQPPIRVLRGDWEPPRWVALVYHPPWASALGKIITALPGQTRALIVTPHDHAHQDVESWLASLGVSRHRAWILQAPVESPWIRDYGPFEVRDLQGRHTYLDAGYSSRPGDDPLPEELSHVLGVPVENLPEELDGGAVVANGRGFCVSTVEAFALHNLPADDPTFMDLLQQQMGCEILTLVPALSEDETKHVDMFLQFVSPSRAILAKMDPRTEDGMRLNAAARLLREAALRRGLPLEIVRVPMVMQGPGVYLTYVNGLQVGDRYLVPRFRNSPPGLEASAWEALARAMPERHLIPISADDMIVLNGAIHCITLGLSSGEVQIPRGAFTPSP